MSKTGLRAVSPSAIGKSKRYTRWFEMAHLSTFFHRRFVGAFHSATRFLCTACVLIFSNASRLLAGLALLLLLEFRKLIGRRASLVLWLQV